MPRNSSIPLHIQLTWTDLANITRCKMTTNDCYHSTFRKGGMSFPVCMLSVPYMRDAPYESPSGEVQFRPDKEMPQHLPWLEDTAFTFGRFYDDGEPWVYCPRSFLVAQEEKLEKIGLKMHVGFELEFYLLNQDHSPVDATVFAETKSFQGKTWKVISGIIEGLGELEIPIWMYHAESGKGQFEISIGPFTASMLKAADSLVMARQAIYHIAAVNGMKATFLPKPFKYDIGSACHTHVSLTSLDGQNFFSSSPTEGTQFIGGIFHHLPNMVAIFNPTGNSFDRLQPDTWSGAFQCIGTENKEAAIRLIRKGTVLQRFEIKTPDSTSNPYLVLGSIIGAGIDGIKKGDTLPEEIYVNPINLPIEARPPRLPTSLAEAIKKFSESEFNRSLYGDKLFHLLLQIRKGEEEYWSSQESYSNKMKLLLQRY